MPDVIKYHDLEFAYRPETTDWGIIQEACGGLNVLYFDVEPGEVWYDIGAHIGSFTCYAAQKKAYVYSFEPVPDNYELLETNVELNGLTAQVEAWNRAVTADGRDIKLFIDKQNYGNCSMYERGNENFIVKHSSEAKGLTLFGQYCFKIDTEGCEYEILTTIDLKKVDKLIFEWHYWLIDNPESKLEDIYNLLNEAGIMNTATHGGYMHYGWR